MLSVTELVVRLLAPIWTNSENDPDIIIGYGLQTLSNLLDALASSLGLSPGNLFIGSLSVSRFTKLGATEIVLWTRCYRMSRKRIRITKFSRKAPVMPRIRKSILPIPDLYFRDE